MHSDQPPPRWILVAGTGNYHLSNEECWCAESIGRELARGGFNLVVGGWPGVDHVTARCFEEGLRQSAPHVSLANRLLQIVPMGVQPDFTGGYVEYVPRGPLEWVEGLRHSQAAI